MNAREKARFIRELSKALTAEMLAAIPKMPEEWDGHELRQYMADKSAGVVFSGTMPRKRLREYRNTRLVENF
jgi:hypothetical protein